jgi:hypothetical protein
MGEDHCEPADGLPISDRAATPPSASETAPTSLETCGGLSVATLRNASLSDVASVTSQSDEEAGTLPILYPNVVAIFV